MKSLTLQTLDSVPAESKDTLALVQKRYGHISNLWATFANSPVVLNGYFKLNEEWEKSSLTIKERELVFLAISVVNDCPYCIAGYTTGLKALHVSSDIIRQVLDRERLNDLKTDALISLTQEIVTERGFVSDTTKKRFTDAGYNEIVIMELLVGVAMKTMANYLDHLFPIPIDHLYETAYNKVISEAHE